MNNTRKKALITSILTILVLFVWVFFLQKSFQKINPYDPNWMYGEDMVNVDKSYYQATKDKNLYFTYLLYNWNIKFAESTANNLEKYLLKNDTLDFVEKMIDIWDSESFSRFYSNVSSLILFNQDLTPGLRLEYSDRIRQRLASNKEVKELTTDEANKYKSVLAKEFEYCSKYNLPLNNVYSDLYWWIAVADRLYNKNLDEAFCEFLYSWFQTKKISYYEQMMNISHELDKNIFWEDYIYDLTKRLKEYYYDLAISENKTKQEWDILRIEDNLKLQKLMREINNAARNSTNSNTINKIVNE